MENAPFIDFDTPNQMPKYTFKGYFSLGSENSTEGKYGYYKRN